MMSPDQVSVKSHITAHYFYQHVTAAYNTVSNKKNSLMGCCLAQ